MARVVSVQLYRNNIRAMWNQGGQVYQAIDRTGRDVANQAKRNANVDTGVMRAGIRNETNTESGRIVARISTPVEYGLYQHEGTGIYGPRHRVITPKKGRFLRFEVSGPTGPRQRGDRGQSNVVYARYVRGVPPNPFLYNALVQVSPWPVIRNQ